MTQTQTQWSIIQEFPNYLISDQGEVFNIKNDRFMRTSVNNHGHMKITLTDEDTGERFDRSVSKLVAEAFVEVPTELCDYVVILDGDLTHVSAENLVWRPRWYAWKYARQLKDQQPVHYHNLRVLNFNLNRRYSSIIEAGMVEGLLFGDIWRSTYSGTGIFPYGHVFEIV